MVEAREGTADNQEEGGGDGENEEGEEEDDNGHNHDNHLNRAALIQDQQQ